MPTTVYILIWPWIPDSPRWHIRRDHTDTVKTILLDAVKVNDRKYLVPHNLEDQINVQAAASLKIVDESNWWALWSDRKSTITMVMLHTAWAVYVTNYNGMLLNIRAFSRDFLVVNTIVAGLSEIFGVLLAWFFVIKTAPNKWYWTGIFNIGTGILTCFGFFIPETSKCISATFRLAAITFHLYFVFSIGKWICGGRHDIGNALENGNNMFAIRIGNQHR